jgi:transcriptional regulator with XRE-family HTH domain
MTDETVLRELGGRLARQRIDRNITQRELGEQAGVGRAAVQRIENGEPVTTVNLIRVLRALDLIEALDAAVAAPPASPIQALRTGGRQRRRARASTRGPAPTAGPARPWRWGDER